jgi:phage-related minor tail protein
MALRLGELVAYLRADDTALARGLETARGMWERHGEQVRQAMDVAGVAAAGALTAGLVGALDLDAAKNRLAAQLGSASYARELGSIAGRIYGEGFGQSASDAMQAIRSVMQSGLLPEDATNASIQSITTKAMALADAFELDVTEAARAAGQMVRNGLAGSAAEAMDILARGFQQTGDQAGDLLDTFGEYSTQFRKLGVDGAQAMGILSQGARGGARDLDVVADAMKEFSIRAVDGSTTTADGFKAIGVDAGHMAIEIGAGGERANAALDLTLDRIRAIKDPVRQSQAAVALFGTQAEDLGAALYAIDPSSAVDALGQVGGAADKMVASLGDSPQAKLESFKRKFQQAFVEKAAEALPYLEKVAGWVERNQTLASSIAGTLVTVAMATVAITAATKVYTAAAIAAGVAQKAWNLAAREGGIAAKISAAAQWLWNAAMAANPIVLIIVAIVALVAGIYLLWTHCAAFRNFWKATWDFIVAAAMLWWRTFSAFWTTVGDWFASLLRGWWNLFTGFWGAIGDGIASMATWIYTKINQVVDFITGMPGRISAAASGMWDGIKDSFRGAINWIIGRWNSLSFHIPEIDTHIPGIGRVGGMSLSMPRIPELATGGTITAPGWARVGERGREDVWLPGGAQVQPNGRPADMRELASAVAAAVRDAVAGLHVGAEVHVDGRALDESVVRTLQRNPRQVALASRAGDRPLAYGGI